MVNIQANSIHLFMSPTCSRSFSIGVSSFLVMESVHEKFGFRQLFLSWCSDSPQERHALKTADRNANESKKKRFTKKRRDIRQPEARDLVSSSVDSGITSRPNTSQKDDSLSKLSAPQMFVLPPHKVWGADVSPGGHLLNTPSDGQTKISPSTPDTFRSGKPKEEKRKKHRKNPNKLSFQNEATEGQRFNFEKKLLSFPPFISSATTSNTKPMSVEIVEERAMDSKNVSQFLLKENNMVNVDNLGLGPKPFFADRSTFASTTGANPFAPQFSCSTHVLSTKSLSEAQRPRKRKNAARSRGPKPKTAAKEISADFAIQQLPNIPENTPSALEQTDSQHGVCYPPQEMRMAGTYKSDITSPKPVFFSQLSQLSRQNLDIHHGSFAHGSHRLTGDINLWEGNKADEWFGGRSHFSKPSTPASPSESSRRSERMLATPGGPAGRGKELPIALYNQINPEREHHAVSNSPKRPRNIPSRQSSSIRDAAASISSAEDVLESRDPKNLDKLSFPIVTYTSRPRSLAPLTRRGHLPELTARHQTSWMKRNVAETSNLDIFRNDKKPS